jgi:hypothetical protein
VASRLDKEQSRLHQRERERDMAELREQKERVRLLEETAKKASMEETSGEELFGALRKEQMRVDIEKERQRQAEALRAEQEAQRASEDAKAQAMHLELDQMICIDKRGHWVLVTEPVSQALLFVNLKTHERRPVTAELPPEFSPSATAGEGGAAAAAEAAARATKAVASWSGPGCRAGAKSKTSTGHDWPAAEQTGLSPKVLTKQMSSVSGGLRKLLGRKNASAGREAEAIMGLAASGHLMGELGLTESAPKESFFERKKSGNGDGHGNGDGTARKGTKGKSEPAHGDSCELLAPHVIMAAHSELREHTEAVCGVPSRHAPCVHDTHCCAGQMVVHYKPVILHCTALAVAIQRVKEPTL